MDKLYRESLLYDFYGELLTKRQRDIYEEAVFEDFSPSEIAKEHGISRQAVHDLVKRTDHILASYEEKLQLVKKFLDIKTKVQEIRNLTDDERIRALAQEILEDM